MIRTLGTILAGLLGLAFGSFLNVCLSRWPEGESVVTPRSHCRNCDRTLSWWENIPLVSWITLRGRCRTCQSKISWRYPAVELTVGVFWAFLANQFLSWTFEGSLSSTLLLLRLTETIGQMVFVWMLIALLTLDAEHLWLPNWLTLPGTAIGFLLAGVRFVMEEFLAEGQYISKLGMFWNGLLGALISILISAGMVLVIRWTYWLIRRREGIGLGDAKLMAMLGAWLGLSGALFSFAIGVMLGAMFALIALAIPAARRESNTWLAAKLPLGTFLCIGGIISALWGQPIINAYLRWAGF